MRDINLTQVRTDTIPAGLQLNSKKSWKSSDGPFKNSNPQKFCSLFSKVYPFYDAELQIWVIFFLVLPPVEFTDGGFSFLLLPPPPRRRRRCETLESRLTPEAAELEEATNLESPAAEGGGLLLH